MPHICSCNNEYKLTIYRYILEHFQLQVYRKQGAGTFIASRSAHVYGDVVMQIIEMHIMFSFVVVV